MKRIAFFCFAFFLAVGAGRVSADESIRGHLGIDSHGEVVLKLELPTAKLATLADKNGRSENFSVADLVELIRERFHYLLRWRIDGEEFAPTSIVLTAPFEGAPLPEFLPAIVTWRGLPPGKGTVVTQVDSPSFRLELDLVEQRVIATPRAVKNERSVAQAVDVDRMIGWLVGFAPMGIVQLLFVVGLYFSAREGRNFLPRLGVFLGAHGLAFTLGAIGIIALTPSQAVGIDFAVGFSLITIAVGNCLARPISNRLAVALFSAAGGLHGLGMARALSGTGWPDHRIFSFELALLAAVGAIALFDRKLRQHAWDRPEIAVPVSFAIGFGGLAWTIALLA